MPPTSVKRGDIFWGTFPEDESTGREQHGRRPCLVVSVNTVNDRLDVVVIVPLSSKIMKVNRQFRILIPENHKITEVGTNGCPGESVALCEQVRLISKARLDDIRVAHLTPTAIASVEAGLAYVLGIP